jgi:uncharacterized protein YyaL (SSP411 family)
MPVNELSQAASPYLLQHAHNPVAWRLWTPAALQEAQRLNKPILLSIGYAACHWCHVMAHESFEDAETAAVMNELFVNIKVDREERPDIDHIYMSALHAFGERGGWPLTMFLTPQGEPFWGGTYFPKVSRYGMPAFTHVLKTIADIFKTEPDKIAYNTRIVRENLAKSTHKDGDALSLAMLDRIAPQVANFVDPNEGGLQGAPKFPNTPIFEFLWRAGARSKTKSYRDLVKLTLTRMSQGGIYDHLGGGFARYSVDDRWLVPHFEKMLYDNAQLLELLALCAKAENDPLLRARAGEIVAWLTRDMTNPQGGFCASLDADSEGEEGKFYVWTWSELVALLGPADAKFLGAFYDATEAGNWTEEHHGKTVIILNQLLAKPASAEDEARLAPLKEKLFLAREQRVHPGLDDKIMADWNGLMIAALVNAATLLDQPQWITPAVQAYEFIAETLNYEDADGNRRLAHSWRAGVMVKPGLALDYAAMMRAALALHEARNMAGLAVPRRDYLADAIAWAEALDRHHLDRDTGLLAMAADDASDVILRLAPTGDDAIPNAHPVYLSALVRLAGLTGDGKWLARADAIFAAVAPAVRANFMGHVGILNALDFRLRAAEIVTVGLRRQELYAAALGLPFSDRILLDIDRLDAIPHEHPAESQVQIAGDAAAFVCSGGTCSLPVRAPEELVKVMAGRLG